MCTVSLLAQDKCPHILAVKLSPTLNVLGGTDKVPTPAPINEVSTVVLVISVPSEV